MAVPPNTLGKSKSPREKSSIPKEVASTVGSFGGISKTARTALGGALTCRQGGQS